MTIQNSFEKMSSDDRNCKTIGFEEIIGNSEPMRKVLSQIKLVSPTDVTVLINGESGVGKELVARAIHENSQRNKNVLIKVNCASISPELFESEFFGHVKGAFTGAIRDHKGRFELSHMGTIFLDEIGEIPLHIQGKLLRVLQENEFERVGEGRTRKMDVRILAATNRNLLIEMKKGRFRKDLYYRLNVFPIDVPPLREHPEDIEPLVAHFIEQNCQSQSIPYSRPTQGFIEALKQYPWHGNVRELQNVIKRCMILAQGGPLVIDDRTLSLHQKDWNNSETEQVMDKFPLKSLKDKEKRLVFNALEKSNWKIYGSHGAAALLGLKPTTLASKIKKLDLNEICILFKIENVKLLISG